MIDRRDFVLGALIAVVAPCAARAQQTRKPRRIAYLTSLSLKVSEPWMAQFGDGMRQLGYAAGRDFVVESRYSAGDFGRLPGYAAELASLKPDLFLAYGAEAAEAAAKAAPALPVVLANAQDPVASGLVASLARPSGNITGMSDYHAASSAKRLEILKEALPQVSRVAVFWRAAHAAHPQQLKDLQAAAAALGVKIAPMHIKTGEDIERAFVAMKAEAVGAVLMLGDALLTTRRARVIELALQHRIAAMYTTRIFAQEGGLISYGTDIGDLFRRSATHVDRIFKGAKPGDLPIEQPVKFELVLNLKTAKAIGVALPRSILLRADEVIE